MRLPHNGALAFNGNVLYGLNLGFPPQLVTIDTTTGVVTDVAPTLTALDAIAFSLPAAVLAGDYNNNGTVDAGDYDVWRKYVNATHVLANDPIGGTVGAARNSRIKPITAVGVVLGVAVWSIR